MSVSIYYQFKSKQDLVANGQLEKIVQAWDAMFDGDPYESWCWYEPELEENIFLYQGSTSLPMHEEEGLDAFMKALDLLSELRQSIGGDDWSVSLDDLEIAWDEEAQQFVPG